MNDAKTEMLQRSCEVLQEYIQQLVAEIASVRQLNETLETKLNQYIEKARNLEAKLAFENMSKPGTFAWAVEQMREGKRVRRQSWVVRRWELSNNNRTSGTIYQTYPDEAWMDDIMAIVELADIDATDWEIAED